jgi:hypothetical protein
MEITLSSSVPSAALESSSNTSLLSIQKTYTSLTQKFSAHFPSSLFSLFLCPSFSSCIYAIKLNYSMIHDQLAQWVTSTGTNA